MPYKIYTYADPYNLDKADFWNEISSLPHFCGARTLVNGLKDVLGDSIKGLICNLDALINHDDIYKSWTGNIGLRLQQYSALSSYFKRLLDSGKLKKEFYMALSQNQNYFLDAIRLFIELDIPASSIDGTRGNLEQQLFVYMLGKAQRSKLFSYPNTPTKETLKDVMVDLAKTEVDDCRKHKKSEREIKRCERVLEITRKQSLNAIVVHGVHQFTPAQLRLLIAMEKMGLTLIFLFNYQKKYSKIYSSWSDIYSCFDVAPHHDTVVPEYFLPTMQNPSNALACAIGELCEDRHSVGGTQLKQWHQLYKSIELREFANITEYAHFVSNHVETARNKYRDSRRVMERGNEVWDNAGVLRRLEEQVYTANRDIHTLLYIYYPEFSPERHFLSYPIGQFFSAIYRLWDYEKGCITFEANAIKECLSSNILGAAPGEILLRTFCNVEVLFEYVTTYEEFEIYVAGGYLQNYDRISSAKSTDVVFPLRQLEVYNKYKVTKKDVELMVKAIREINEIATQLFAQDNSHEEFINFGDHFRKLKEFLKQHELDLANEKERELISALQLRLEQVKPEKSEFSGTFRDLREGIHFFLKQKSDAEQGPDWIVKNFEQIDGDILQSKRQFENEEKKTYHFACLSDRDMNQTVNDQLPWPLTDEFLSAAYLPQDLQFQIYCKTLDRRSEFLRYALFYGLCYNRSNVRLSFVKQYGEETTEPYALLSILGLEPKPGPIENVDHVAPFNINVPQQYTKEIKYERSEMMDMFLCPYRYFLDYVMSDSPVVHGSFLFQKYYENLLIEAVWKRIAGKKRSEALKYLGKIVDQESAKFEPYFKFWKDTEILDLKRRAKNYLEHEKIANGISSTVEPFNNAHMKMRRLFGAAKFVVDISEVERKNPYSSFDALAVRKYPVKEYSLHSLPESDLSKNKVQLVDELRSETKCYINQADDRDKTAIPADWCNYCSHRGNCMESYLAGDLIESGLTTDSGNRRRTRVTTGKSTMRKDRPIVTSALSKASDAVISNVLTPSILMPECVDEAMVSHAPQALPASEPANPNLTEAVVVPLVAESQKSSQTEVSSFETMLRSIQEMVSENSQEIMELKRELATRRTRKEDTSRVEATIAEQERKSQELLSRLKETEERLAASESQKLILSNTVRTQEALLEKRKAHEFTEAEAEELHKYAAIIIFDTCSIMNFPNLLSGVRDGELVVVPKDVNNELENHKTNHYYDERKMKAQRAITAIFNYKRKYPLIYADAMVDLIPKVYRAEAGERELTDNKILTVAIRYRKYTDIPVVFITDDRSLSNKAAGEDIEVWTAEDFLAPPVEPLSSETEVVPPLDERTIPSADEVIETSSVDANAGTGINMKVSEERPEAVAAEQRHEKAKSEFLAQKVSVKNLKLDARQISILQNNGIKTLADFMVQTEATFSGMKAKKGMLFTAKYLKEQESIRKKLENL